MTAGSRDRRTGPFIATKEHRVVYLPTADKYPRLTR
jgi:hypothetical protein